jgi:hypothetical protein
MKDEAFKKVLEFCKTNNVEINFSPEGIGLWADIQKTMFTIPDVKPENIKKHIFEINVFRKSKWRVS